MEGFRSPTRTFKLRGGEGVVHEGREREISTPFTTSSAGGLGLMEAPPAPRKKSFSPSTALRSREIRLKGLGDSGDSGKWSEGMVATSKRRLRFLSFFLSLLLP